MAAPLLFFFVFMTIFAAIMYVFEVAVCFPGEIDDGAGSTTWWWMTSEDPNDAERCAMQDMFDSMWVVLVTMTSVGYGGKSPVTPTGKMVSMIAALFGAFYMAMPLTIVGSQFYEIYVMQEQKLRSETAKRRLKNAARTIMTNIKLKDPTRVISAIRGRRKFNRPKKDPLAITRKDAATIFTFCRYSRAVIMEMDSGKIDAMLTHIYDVIKVVPKYITLREE